VKTYPLPSRKYGELVCTAGVREDGSFVRIYPIAYRHRDKREQFSKYQWIEIEIERNRKDPRPESFRPVEGAIIKPLGKPLHAGKDNWAERKRYVLAKGVQTMCGLASMPQTQRSLGIIRPKKVFEFVAEETRRDWKPEWQKLYEQLHLFGDGPKPLLKIPYKFSYRFSCEEPACKGRHKMMIEDWELGRLFLLMVVKYSDESKAMEKVREKFFDRICAQDMDTHFFVGTVLAYGSWIILGTFWPKKEEPGLPGLF
jgi:hypothetical protein